MALSFGSVISFSYICTLIKTHIMKAIVTNIQYDTDGEVVDLPTQLEIEVPSDLVEEQDIDDFVSDEITTFTGFCHFGFEMKLI